MTTKLLTQSIDPTDLLEPGAVTWPTIAAGSAALLILAAAVTAAFWATRRAAHAVNAAIAAERLTTRRVLIAVAVVAALGVAGIGGVRSFNAVSEKFDSPLVPLVADGMIVACTALRLAALTRGWRIPGALVTTYVFIGGTVWLNVDTARGIADAVAHALAPLAYAVLVEMLAHLLRLHMKLAQPAKPKLSALTWFTSPVITTRVWLHLSRTGSDDPAAARALVQQVVRMASRLATLCPSHRLRPFDAARGARTACLQTIRDGLLSASELAALLPATRRLTPGELLALVDSAALGLTEPAETAARIQQPTAPVWLIAYLLGALRTETAPAPVHHSSRTGPTAPVHSDDQNSAPAPVHAPHRTDSQGTTAAGPGKAAPPSSRVHRSDADDLAELRRVSDAEHGGGPLSQREITRVLDCGFSKARRLADLAGWLDPAPARDGDPTARHTETRGQLQLDEPSATDENKNDTNDETTTDRELETSSSR